MALGRALEVSFGRSWRASSGTSGCHEWRVHIAAVAPPEWRVKRFAARPVAGTILRPFRLIQGKRIQVCQVEVIEPEGDGVVPNANHRHSALAGAVSSARDGGPRERAGMGVEGG